MAKKDDVIIWGGIGEKKSNKGTQWYLQNRVYDSKGISPSLSSVQFCLIIQEDNDD